MASEIRASEIGAPLDDRTVRRVQDSFARQGLMAHLGAVLHEVRSGLVVVRLPFRPELTQQHGYFHAGATGAIADTAGGFAAFTLFPEDSAVLSVEYKINLLNPGRGEFLEAVGRVVKSGRTLTVCQLEVNAHHGDSVSPVAVGQQTLICLRGRPD
ncbi:PaaI family thioesterase [Rhodospirillum centenum]|uniref:Thioesterase family protein n=1 Tax=Rhodospirillum centenum (strain ATCC 51521 / SW) TaxID=414684 RepID=B6IYL1_RHOCS|nr:PaaI family thioesterase [Rhodospirillum centenum]ACJ01385.1 thioesterase family protein [Rhodospirillum centenum SW]